MTRKMMSNEIFYLCMYTAVLKLGPTQPHPRLFFGVAESSSLQGNAEEIKGQSIGWNSHI